MGQADRPASAIPMELGIRRNQHYKLKEQMDKKGDVAATRKDQPKKEDQSELAAVKQKLKRVKEENEILKNTS